MKKIIYIIAFAGAALLAGCAKEQLPSVPTGKTVISVSIEDSKTTIGELTDGRRSILWDKGDVLCCNGKLSEALDESASGTSMANFVFNDVLEEPYNLLYPASLYTDASSITLPAVAKYVPLAGQGASMAAVTGVIKLSIEAGSDTHKIRNVVVSSATAQLSGAFSIDYAAGTIASQSSADADKSVSVTVNQTLPAEGALELFIPAPAGTYSFTARIIDVEGHYMDVTTTSAKTIVAGQVSAFPTVTFAPTGTQVDVEITSAEDLVKFAQDWNSGAFDYNPNVKVVNSIVFDATTSADFVATGGIGVQGDETLGTSDNYFNGIFDGDGKSISNLESSVSLFNFVGAAGYIRNVVMDASSVFNFTASAGQYAAIAGRLKGSVSDCTVNSDITVGNITTTGVMYVGGVVGRTYGGSVKNCSMTGDLNFPSTNGKIAKAFSFGGVVGQNQNEGDDGGTVSGCTFSGNITVGASSSFSGPSSSEYVNVGGVVGTNSTDSRILSCTTAEGVVIDVCGVFKNRIGGICGNNSGVVGGEGKECVNNAAIKFTSNGARADTTPTYAGGICGLSLGPVSYCTNNGAIATVCNSTSIYLGGIVAGTQAEVSHCTNETSGTITRTSQTSAAQANRYIYIGGVAGVAAGSSAYEISNVENKAEVLSNLPGTSTATTTLIGGVVGQNECAGLIISNSTNSGYIHVNDGTTAAEFPISALGGILGASKVEVAITSCVSAGKLNCVYSTKKNARPAYVGGIAGLLDTYENGSVTKGTGIKATISGCSVSGGVQATNYNNTATAALTSCNFVGGIVGAAIGKNTTDNAITISNCSTSSTANSEAGGRLYNYRGYCGGVAGYIKNAVVTGGSGSFAKVMNANSNNTAKSSAGLASVVESSVFDGCVVANDVQNSLTVAGFANSIDASSEFRNCILNNVSLAAIDDANAKTAVFANTSVAGAKFTDNKVSGTISGAAITSESAFVNSGDATISGTVIE
ncbi:MAG: hypothetical protein MJY57_02975 [Bacteroidales bacterium]|nr:hypothetical protein [Bacteroidales bacterium]